MVFVARACRGILQTVKYIFCTISFELLNNLYIFSSLSVNIQEVYCQKDLAVEPPALALIGTNYNSVIVVLRENFRCPVFRSGIRNSDDQNWS